MYKNNKFIHVQYSRNSNHLSYFQLHGNLNNEKYRYHYKLNAFKDSIINTGSSRK